MRTLAQPPCNQAMPSVRAACVARHLSPSYPAPPPDPPRCRVQALYNAMFMGLSPLSDYVSTCSYGKATLDATNSRIVTIRLPCSGISHVTGMRWDSSSCDQANLFFWMQEAEWYIENVLQPSWNHKWVGVGWRRSAGVLGWWGGVGEQSVCGCVGGAGDACSGWQ